MKDFGELAQMVQYFGLNQKDLWRKSKAFDGHLNFRTKHKLKILESILPSFKGKKKTREAKIGKGLDFLKKGIP